MVSRAASVTGHPNRSRNRNRAFRIIHIAHEQQPQVQFASRDELPSPKWWKAANFLIATLLALAAKFGTLSPQPLTWSFVIALIVRAFAYVYYAKSELPGSNVSKICDIVGYASTLLAVASLILMLLF